MSANDPKRNWQAAQVILIGEFDADVDVLIKAVGIAIYGGNP